MPVTQQCTVSTLQWIGGRKWKSGDHGQLLFARRTRSYVSMLAGRIGTDHKEVTAGIETHVPGTCR